jgi:hypothetical protein
MSSLENLFSLSAAHLHNSHSRSGDKDDETEIEIIGNSNSNNVFSLKQLVPVHRSLLEATTTSGVDSQRKENDGDEVMGNAINENENEKGSSDSENNYNNEDRSTLRWLKEFLDGNRTSMSDNDDDNDKELALCQRILLGSPSDDDDNDSSCSQHYYYDDRKKLLVWQYLLQRARNNSNSNSNHGSASMEWLSVILFHYILPTTAQQKKNQISDQLMHIVLELSLEWVSEDETTISRAVEATTTTTTTQREKNWSELRTQLSKDAENSLANINNNNHTSSSSLSDTNSMPQSSRIVATIVSKYLEKERNYDHHDPLLPFFLSMYYEHLWLNLKFCCGTNTTNNNTRFLSDVSKTMLLPVLNEFQSKNNENTATTRAAHCHELGTLLMGKLFSLLEEEGVFANEENLDDDNNNDVGALQHLLLVATTVLCPLLPWYLRQQQQQHPLLWKFIYVCLQQGRRSVISGRECDNPTRSSSSSPSGNLAFASGAGGVASMLRRRALYLLDVLVAPSEAGELSSSSSPSSSSSTIWKEYILCVETFEMEGERHIIDQIWPVVAKLVEEAKKNGNGNSNINASQSTPPITPQWIELLVGRILSSEQLAVRKLGVFRLLQVLGRPVTPSSLRQQSARAREQQETSQAVPLSSSSAAAVMDVLPTPDNNNPSKNKNKKRESSKQPQKQNKKKTKKSSSSASKGGGTLEVLSTEMLLTILSPQTFLWDVLIPSWDSLGGSSVGYTIHLDNPKTGSNASGSPVEKFTKIDMVPLFCQTITNYAILASTSVDSISSSSSSSLMLSSPSLFWKGLWDWERVVCHLSAKTLISVYRSVSKLLEVAKPNEAAAASTSGDSMIRVIPMDDDDIKGIWYTFARLFQNNTMVLCHRRQLLSMLSKMISKAQLPHPNASETKTKIWSPFHVLSLLTLFSSSYFPALDSEDVTDWSIESEEMLVMVGTFVHQFESQSSAKDHAVTVGAALASAFVTGQVSLPSIADETNASPLGWNPVEGSSTTDQELGWAVSLFCTLAVSKKNRHTSGELLWPAINKGLSQSAGVILSKGHHPKADFVARALLLLENGCKLRQLSGLGNGDLVVNPKTQQMMPPPPNIEQMLQNSIDFIQWHIRMLLATESHRQEEPEDGHKSKRFTGSYAFLISQLKILHLSYPSSQAVSSVMNELLQKSIEDLRELLAGKNASSGEGDVKKLLLVALIYGACSCGAEPEKKSYVSLIRLLMNTGLSTAGKGQPRVWVKSSRSIIQYARWAAISCILPKLLEAMSDNASDQAQDEIDRMVDDLLKEGVRASSITPSDAIKPLFDCIIMSSREWISISNRYNPRQAETLCGENLTQIVKTLLSLIKQSTRSRESACMLNDFCALIFQTKLLREEYDRIATNNSSSALCKTPIRDGFRQLIKMAGRYRPQITRAVLCRITVGWLGEEGSDSRGISAIPYREDIVKLLLHKEGKYDETSSNQSMEELPKSGVTEIPSNTNYHSITRAFLLVFFGELPDPEAGLNPTVKKELLQYTILELLEQATPEKGTHPSLSMRGTPVYCMKMRAWQALCILSRFVTDEIASEVCLTVFGAMNELLHNQIRYFIENFTIKCATMHPSIFGEAFLNDIRRTDLSLQHISSLMILGGNFILGKYQLDYFTQNDEDKCHSKRVLAGVVPWLSSTQGFSRAIAQLIVYQLIPRIISIESNSNTTNSTTKSTVITFDNDWYLKSTYNFLDQNREMKRLRNKQTKFFERYDCELMCTPEGIFSIKVDEAEEADPLHLIDAMKEALRSTYDEAHEADAPSWKHVEELIVGAADVEGGEASDENNNNDIASTVQRKIIPLDSLNLALEDLREQRLSNARGAHKQNLIVCASLVDKVPNLAGLARTCEIFAAQSLILPDLSLSKMDNFQSISVGAADWIDMEEVKEEVGGSVVPMR